MKIRSAFILILMTLVALLYIALRPREVVWSEEVPLNTGQTIWVERSVVYSLKGDAGNPMDFDFRPSWNESISFEWRGRIYKYYGDADLMVLAISPEEIPVLIAPADHKDWGWHHGFRCTTPFYVQLIPEPRGRGWRWQPKLAQWAVGLPRNLMGRKRSMGEMPGRYTVADKQREDRTGALATRGTAIIDSDYSSHNCKRGN